MYNARTTMPKKKGSSMPRRNGLQQWPFLFCLPLLTLAALAGGCRKQAQAGPPPPPPEVAFLEIKPEAVILKKELPGRTTPYLVAEIRPQASGIIRQRLFTEGSDVKAGDVLYEIDPETYNAARDNAEAAVQAAKADQATSVAALKQAEAALVAAHAAENRAEANAEPLRLRARRYYELLASKAVSQQDYDDIASALKQSEAGIESAKAAVVSAEADILRAQAAILAADAAVAYAEAGLKSAVINLSYTKIAAPISGRIGRSAVTTGALVTAHQPVPLATIQQLDPIYVDVPQATAELLQLQRRLTDGRLTHNGSSTGAAALLLEDNTAYPEPGTLQFRDVTVDPSTGSFFLRLVFPNPKSTLLPGMFVRGVIDEGVNEQAILVPQQAVSRNSKGETTVLLVNADNTVRPQPVRVDRAVGNRWMISAGLTPGDRVIVEGSLRVRPGMVVNAVPFVDDRAGGAGPGNPSPSPAPAN